MKQNSYCTEVGTLPGTDFRLPPKYMEMLNLTEAWQFGRGEGVKVAVIDTGVTPHPRFPHLIPGGDYVMAGGDGLSDCDAHGTIVASMIGAAPANGAAPPPAVPRRPVTIPTTEKPPPPQTVTLSPVPPQTQTITVVPAPPSEEGARAPPGAGPGASGGPGSGPGRHPRRWNGDDTELLRWPAGDRHRQSERSASARPAALTSAAARRVQWNRPGCRIDFHPPIESGLRSQGPVHRR
ncbi:subtilase family protein [Mycobacterium kansasii]|uniref:Subtilase family protein n=1 Tax=Mycobacterium kansasii TaxID=1768 RepID=A0A1V3X3S5_MYCKA|nr:subtilase family protein [Mycobacterium kansasii]